MSEQDLSEEFDQEFLELIQQTFATESKDQLSSIDQAMMALEAAVGDAAAVQNSLGEIFRNIHSLKAAAGALSYVELMNYLHHLESYFDKLRNKQLAFDLTVFNKIQKIIDLVNDDVQFVISHKRDCSSRENDQTLLAILEHAPAVDSSSQGKNKNTWKIFVRPYRDFFKDEHDPLGFLQQLQAAGEIKTLICHTDEIPPQAQFHWDEIYLFWDIVLETSLSLEEIESIFMFMYFQSEITITSLSIVAESSLATVSTVAAPIVNCTVVPAMEKIEVAKIQGHIPNLMEIKGPQDIKQERSQPKNNTLNSIRVNIGKLDHLVNLVGELVIAQSRIQTLAKEIIDKSSRRNILERCSELSRLIEDLKHGVMQTRMLPVENLFSQFHRFVRDLAQKQEKIIKLQLLGQETELDKNIIEKLSDPLKHILRNAIDHGIETLEDRNKLHKAKEASIRIRAYQKEGKVYIEVSDDGRGLDKNKIVAKALEKGLIESAHGLQENEIFSLIFLPGFSTAEKITEISGRGVGMDVVKNVIDELGGIIDIQSEKNKGCTFTIKLPLTLAIIEGLLFRVGKRTFIIPLLAVNDTYRPRRSEIETIEGKAECINIGNKLSTLVRLHKILEVQGAQEDPTRAMMLGLSINHKNYSFMIDEVIGHQQIVIKSLEINYEKVIGFSGVTILGDGSIAPIIEPTGICHLFKHHKIACNSPPELRLYQGSL